VPHEAAGERVPRAGGIDRTLDRVGGDGEVMAAVEQRRPEIRVEGDLAAGPDRQEMGEERKGDVELANSVYSGVPSQYFGLEQIIEIGPMSGKSNVIFWLEHRGIPPSEELVDRIFQRAKASDRCLTEEEILACCQNVSAGI